MTSEIDSFSTAAEQDAYRGSREAVLHARDTVARSVNFAMVRAYWEIGRQANAVYGQESGYGKAFLEKLSHALTAEFGKGFTYTNICRMCKFNRLFQNLATVSQDLSWSHYVLLISVEDDNARDYYQQEAIEGNLSVRTLRRMIQTTAYERLLHLPDGTTGKLPAASAGHEENAEGRFELRGALQYPIAAALKDPFVLEFLNLGRASDYLEDGLEQQLIDKLEDFLLELGRGFAFVARQMRISDNSNDYYIDLVFYNYLARCFVLVDLKTGKLNPRDVGQMDFYVRLFGETHPVPGDNPPVGLLLCATKDSTVARYSALATNPQLYAAQYLPYLPTEDELEAEIRRRMEEYEQCHILLQDGVDALGGENSR